MNKQTLTGGVMVFVALAMLAASYIMVNLKQAEKESYTLHGEKIKDKYLWMEDLESPRLKRWVAAQNRRARKFLDNLKERQWLEDQFPKEWRIKEGVKREILHGKSVFYSRTNIGDNYPTYYTRAGLGFPEEMLLNPNEWKNNRFITGMFPSPYGRYVAFNISDGEKTNDTILIKDVQKKTELLPQIEGVFQDWAAGDEGFFYSSGYIKGETRGCQVFS
jgi:protease II